MNGSIYGYNVFASVASATVPQFDSVNAQYTPPTRLSCRVELSWRCVHKSQLLGDMSRRVYDCLNKFANSEVELRRVGGVNAPVRSRDPVDNFRYFILCC